MADNDFSEFSKRMVIVARAIEQNVTKTVRKAALVADQVAVLSTPVDTGRARAGWFVSVGAPSDEVGEPSENAAAKAIAQADGAIERYDLRAGPIFLTNNVSYAPVLDSGSSRQAPNGMTAAALRAASEVIRKANSAS